MIDAILETTATLPDEAIIEQVQSSQEEEEDTEDEQNPTEKIPTKSKTIDALMTFSLFLQSIPCDNSTVEKLRELAKLTIKNFYAALRSKS